MADLTVEDISGGIVRHDGKRGFLTLDLPEGRKAEIACIILQPEGEAVTDEQLDEEFKREGDALEAELGAQDPDKTLKAEADAHAKADADTELKGKLPEGFPGLAALAEAGITTYAQLRKAKDDKGWLHIAGIGPATNAQIAEALGLILGE